MDKLPNPREIASLLKQLQQLSMRRDWKNVKSLILTGNIPNNSIAYFEIIITATIATKDGRADILELLLKHFPKLDTHLSSDTWYNLAYCAAGTGSIEMAEWMVKKYPLTDSTKLGVILNYACKAGNMEFIIWLCEKFNVTAAHARHKYLGLHCTSFSNAVENGHLEIADFLVKKFGFGVEDARAYECDILCMAAEKGQLNAVKWLFEILGMDQDDAGYIIKNPSDLWDPTVFAWLQRRFPYY